MAYLQARGNKFRAKVRIPKPLQDRYGGRQLLERTMGSTDRLKAKVEADTWEAGLRAEWTATLATDTITPAKLRAIYEDGRRAAAAGEYLVEIDGEDDPTASGIEFEIDKLADQDRTKGLNEGEEARLKGLQDALSERRGKEPPRRKEMEPTFSETAADFLTWWSQQDGLKETNTRQQKEATYRLFGGFFSDRPISEVRKVDAVEFMDRLRTLNPHWGKSGKAKGMTWAEVQKQFGDHQKGLSASSLNRHSMALSELWRWAEDRERCAGKNPFLKLRQRLKPGVNQHPYLPWTKDELHALFTPPPKRADLTEAMVVALHTGLRMNEIASLTLSQIREEEGVHYIEVEDAKTPAGNRQVPLHSHIAWLAEIEGEPEDRIWATFNPEGVGKKPGSDASTEFSRFKIAKGFKDRLKVFHSFRKNVTQIMERAGVPESEWAQVLGHERGITYGRYSPDGITIQRKAELIGLIDYPGLELPGQVVAR